jgi:hypothetical protein
MPTCMPYDIEHLAQQQSDADADAGCRHTAHNTERIRTQHTHTPAAGRLQALQGVRGLRGIGAGYRQLAAIVIVIDSS